MYFFYVLILHGTNGMFSGIIESYSWESGEKNASKVGGVHECWYKTKNWSHETWNKFKLYPAEIVLRKTENVTSCF